MGSDGKKIFKGTNGSLMLNPRGMEIICVFLV